MYPPFATIQVWLLSAEEMAFGVLAATKPLLTSFQVLVALLYSRSMSVHSMALPSGVTSTRSPPMQAPSAIVSLENRVEISWDPHVLPPSALYSRVGLVPGVA